jgi:hypothetical protein
MEVYAYAFSQAFADGLEISRVISTAEIQDTQVCCLRQVLQDFALNQSGPQSVHKSAPVL